MQLTELKSKLTYYPGSLWNLYLELLFYHQQNTEVCGGTNKTWSRASIPPPPPSCPHPPTHHPMPQRIWSTESFLNPWSKFVNSLRSDVDYRQVLISLHLN